ncbi:hypothetical protein RHMOL_Rhmol08G0009700 [Rhododendron molle]|uniref:Uncharacterized protein n=1 Tax=Rhododendron molle TaxID=49168 RepID=A0ACC0MJS0_RHOML|nr:hypothetical protein RHMOL_Rhmol08G0009700 [Rhododendron molle]
MAEPDVEGILLELVADGTICLVCQLLFAHGEHVATTFCFHFYHLRCIYRMVANGMFNCSVCRDYFDETLIFDDIIPQSDPQPNPDPDPQPELLDQDPEPPSPLHHLLLSPPVPSTPSCWGAY